MTGIEYVIGIDTDSTLKEKKNCRKATMCLCLVALFLSERNTETLLECFFF